MSNSIRQPRLRTVKHRAYPYGKSNLKLYEKIVYAFGAVSSILCVVVSFIANGDHVSITARVTLLLGSVLLFTLITCLYIVRRDYGTITKG